MKHFCLLAALLLSSIYGWAQPDQLDIITTEDDDYKLSEYLDDGQHHLIIFWASWCSICRNELETLRDYYDEWLETYNTEVIAISTDRESQRSDALSLFQNRSWPYDLIFATESDANNHFGTSGVPHSFLIRSDGEIVYEKMGFRSGDEDKIDEEIRGLGATSAVEELDFNWDVYYKIAEHSMYFSSLPQSSVVIRVLSPTGVVLHTDLISANSQSYKLPNLGSGYKYVTFSSVKKGHILKTLSIFSK